MPTVYHNAQYSHQQEQSTQVHVSEMYLYITDQVVLCNYDSDLSTKCNHKYTYTSSIWALHGFVGTACAVLGQWAVMTQQTLNPKP